MARLSAHRTPGAAVLALASAGLAACDPASDQASEAAPASAQAPHAAAIEGETHAAIARSDEPSRADDDPPGLRLRPPPLRVPALEGHYQVTPERETSRVAQAFQFDAPIYHDPNAQRRVVGLARRNTRLAVDRYVPGEGCDRSWYALLGGGYVCTSDGFSVSSNPTPLGEELRVGPPAVTEALPYHYAKLDTPAPLYWRLPTAGELAASSQAPVKEQATGAHFVAMDQTVEVGETTLHRTVRGYYVRDQDLDRKPMPTMHGELLSEGTTLPLAFVHRDEATLLEPGSDRVRGTAEKFARFAVARIDEHDGQARVIAADGFSVDADEVRVARAVARPEEVGADDRWIHVDLDQQTLVAYEGDTPVLATLVSSGKEGFEPPLGVFRIHKKYTTVTMSGPDPDAGTYAVEHVPWTMYYWGSYALHGAYWHDSFGNVRSHGCTNIPPVDARWLFYWSEPALPTGWHAKVGVKGPWVFFSHGSGADTPS